MATIHDVAERAGLSATTVSRYLNHRIELPPTTAARIDSAVASLDYRPNPMARRLSTGHAETIGLVVPDIASPFHALIAAAVEAEAERHGQTVLLSSARGQGTREIAALKRLHDRQVDGLLLFTNRRDNGTIIARLISESGRVVLIGEDVPEAVAPRIVVENERGAWLATRHLIEAGHRRIAFVGGPGELTSVQDRRAGFERAVREAGLPIAAGHVLTGGYGHEFGSAAARDLLQSQPPPTGIVAAGDYIAIGALRQLRRSGLVVPRDVSVVGFDDMPIAALADPALTTVHQPIEAMGRIAIATVMDILAGRPVKPLRRLRVRLVKRASVAPPPRH